MITPEEFPYIKSLHVNDCYTYKDFDINLHGYKPFSHLILTGKNGSGKTTILNAINDHLSVMLGLYPDLKGNPSYLASSLFRQMKSEYITGERTGWTNIDKYTKVSEQHQIIRRISLYEDYLGSNDYEKKFHNIDNTHLVFSSFKARRWTDTNDVDTPTKDSDFTEALTSMYSGEFFNKNFQQYLVNKRINQAFDIIENRNENIQVTEDFFNEITNKLRIIFDDDKLRLNFIRERFEIEIELTNARKITLKDLPEGFSGLLRILLDLFIRVDLIRKQVGNNSYSPCGIVLIDEPEVHLHLELQEQVLPLLIDLFPNIQFIVATHSPAVIASIKNATIFDLTTKETRTSEETVGRSYSELTTSHFGLENDYSTIADEYIDQIDAIIEEYRDKPAELIQKLETWQYENGQFLAPTLQVKLEYIIAQQNAKLTVAQ